MLLSMTGHGEAHCRQGELAVSVDVRTINSRYLKLSLRSSDSSSALESQIEGVVRKFIRRGTVQINLWIDRPPSDEGYQLNQALLASYHHQLQQVADRLHVAESVRLESLVMLPGVVIEPPHKGDDLQDSWPVIEQAITSALENLSRMRSEEGRAMATDLRANCRSIADRLKQIAGRAPQVVEAYRSRLSERMSNLLSEYNVTIQPADVAREVGLFAERCDISEEIVRLQSHLEQFDTIMDDPESNGKKLEFLTQEMFRETNTIGSKANDAEIARDVIEVKAAIERMREMVQNVE